MGQYSTSNDNNIGKVAYEIFGKKINLTALIMGMTISQESAFYDLAMPTDVLAFERIPNIGLITALDFYRASYSFEAYGFTWYKMLNVNAKVLNIATIAEYCAMPTHKQVATDALRGAEHAMYNYAASLPVGVERVNAFDYYERIRRVMHI